MRPRRRLTTMLAVSGLALAVLAPAAPAAVTFNAAVAYPAAAPWWSASGDFNADGKADIVTASNSTNVISVLLGNGDGTLQAPRNTAAAPSNLNAVAAGDVNGDGRSDVAAAENGSPGAVLVYLSNADGTLAAPTSYMAGNFPQDVVIARIDGDTAADIAVANQTSHDVSVYLNNGTGGFTAAPGSPIADPQGNDLLGIGAADFDQDGKTDLVAGGVNGANPGVLFFKGTGTGAFNAPVSLGGAGAQKPVAGDLNGDGRPDIAAGRSGVGDVVVITRTATGFAAATTVDPDGPTGSANGRIALADFDSDGALDLAVPNTVGPQASKVSIGLGNGDATFTSFSHEAVGSFPRQVVAVDLNGDGNRDVVTSNSGAANVSVLTAIAPAVGPLGSVEFGQQILSTTSPERSVNVRNDGQPRLRPGAVSISGANAAEFSISSNTCTGANLPNGGTCSVGIKFTPAALGTRTASVTIASNGAGAPHSAPLSGTGVAPPNTGPPPLLPGACANRKDGTAGRDILVGTAMGDRLFGLAGDDRLDGLAGSDCLIGGDGADTLNGGDGGDTLNGGRGRDRLSGGKGNDRLTGGAGNDRLTGGAGRNTYSGGAGDDRISAVNRRIDTIDCGRGRHDRATIDRRDKVKHCETVTRRPAHRR